MSKLQILLQGRKTFKNIFYVYVHGKKKPRPPYTRIFTKWIKDIYNLQNHKNLRIKHSSKVSYISHNISAGIFSRVRKTKEKNKSNHTKLKSSTQQKKPTSK